jgi:hypothetical protein
MFHVSLKTQEPSSSENVVLPSTFGETSQETHGELPDPAF